MPSVYRTTATWTGFTGAPGYTKLSWSDLTTDAARDAAGALQRTFFASLATYMQSSWVITISRAIDEFDVATGTLVGAANMVSVPSTVVGSGGSPTYAAGSGAFVTWNTSAIFNGRRVKGRSFLVPLTSAAFESDGTPIGALITGVEAAGNAMAVATTATLSVWSRVFSTTDPPTQIAGNLAPVDTATVKNAASSMRTRRT